MGDKNEWISLKQAAEILGVHPATVRNWADEGKIASNRTVGGHRRFLRADLAKFSQLHNDPIQPIEVQIILQNALGQARMEVGDGALAKQPWYTPMREETRHQMRVLGREILEGLRTYLATGAQDNGLSTAVRLGKEYAVVLSADSLTLPQAMRGFFYFSEFIINAVLTWSEVTQPRSPHDWASLLQQVNTYMNTMLLSLVEYYEEE